jgi:hypothetical protein
MALKAPKTKIYNYPVIEHYGIILAYFDPERNAPDWSIPEVEMAGWLYPKFHTWQLESRPQEIAENSVDIGHFSEVHKPKGLVESIVLNKIKICVNLRTWWLKNRFYKNT